MRIFSIIILAQLWFQQVVAQNSRTYKVNSINADSSELNRAVYQYPGFQRGTVLFTNQSQVLASLNYNYLTGQILFKNPQGAILELAKPETLQYVAIGRDTFYYTDNSYVELFTHYPSVNLSRKQIIKFKGKEQKGAYGTYSSSSSASSLNTYSDENSNRKISIDENALYSTVIQYYLSDRSYNFFSANKKNFYRLFPKQEKALTDYLKNNTVHYNKEEDLLKLIEYLQSQ